MTSLIGRLKKRPEYLRVAKAGRKWVTPGLVLQACRRDALPGVAEGEAIRVGFTASRKVGKAVERNRARRRLRVVSARLLPQVGRAGFDYVVVARAGTLTRPYPDLLGDMQNALEHLRQQPRRGKAKRPMGQRTKQT